MSSEINEKIAVFCENNKTTELGENPDNRQLYGLYPHWEKEYNLINKTEIKYSLPPRGDQGLRDALGRYLAKVGCWNH